MENLKIYEKEIKALYSVIGMEDINGEFGVDFAIKNDELTHNGEYLVFMNEAKTLAIKIGTDKVIEDEAEIAKILE